MERSIGYNRLTCMGYISDGPKKNQTKSDSYFTVGTLKVIESYTTREGEHKESTMYMKFVVWGRQAEIFERTCKKGSFVLLSGTLKWNAYVDRDGNKKGSHQLDVKEWKLLAFDQDNFVGGGPDGNPDVYEEPQSDVPF